MASSWEFTGMSSDRLCGNRAKFCTALKSNLDMLKGEGPLVIQQDGQQKPIDDDQRKVQINTAQAQYQQYCGSK